METTMPEPLTVIKHRLSHDSRFSSLSTLYSYPSIPLRSSSLAASGSFISNRLATSLRTRTPSYTDSYQLEVMKVRQPGLSAPKQGIGETDDPFIDRGPNLIMSPSKDRRARRLCVRYSTGSYDSLRPRHSSRSTSSDSQPPTLREVRRPDLPTLFSSNFGRPDPIYMRPLDLPITFVNMTLNASASKLGMGPVSTWTTINVSADVSPINLPEITALAPLDLVILLDHVPQTSLHLVTQMILGSSVLASNLVFNHDRFALARVDGDATYGFELLLPLGFHPFEVSQSVLEAFSRERVNVSRKKAADLGHAIRQLSLIFRVSPRSAFCHMVFVSATPPERLSMPLIDEGIGFHTVAPQQCLPLENPTHPPGWHISYSPSTDNPETQEIHFMRKVSKIVHQLRTGINPGGISDLRLSLSPGFACQILSIIDGCHLPFLRPGETWTVPVQVGMAASNSWHTSPIYRDARYRGHHSIITDALIVEINALLKESSAAEISQHILTACLYYRHVLLPASNTVHLESHCSVFRNESAAPIASWDREEFAMPSEQDDIASISLGTEESI
ncbi:hypothetical protein N7510_001401 [Penicillium lagena]|uniref:uncharacterized protein n=1 Tax=Penicillium lagena TaxID=94218 RepID=UPI0025405F80|nr:uncharacterized protein N7510_001401 [Penicillium lagena]KAJ5625092.1 hypothetical protein N7510_001401 [Penicillium lagena]